MKCLTTRIPTLFGIILLVAVMVFSLASCQNDPDPGDTPPAAVTVPLPLQNTVWVDTKGNKLEIAEKKAFYTNKQYQAFYGTEEYDLYEITDSDGSFVLSFKDNEGHYLSVQYEEIKTGSTVTGVTVKDVYYNGFWQQRTWNKETENGNNNNGNNGEEGQISSEYWSITWNLNGGAFASGSSHPAQIEKGAVLSKPSPDPAKDGNAFVGWYTNSTLTQEYNFTGPVTANLTLYAKWEEGSQPSDGITVTAGNTLVTKLQWIYNNLQDNNTYIIELTADEGIPYQLLGHSTKKFTIILKGIGKEIIIYPTSNNYGNLFIVATNTTLILDSNITLQARDNLCSSVRIEGGTLIMNDGSKISGNTATVVSPQSNGPAIGGGVYVYEGTFIMNGGEISGNSADLGGGVYVGTGTFIMNGGVISGNTANLSGGGVFGSLTMSGGVISGNTAITLGGGVYGDLTMSGGVISGNTANALGGGVAGSLIMSDGVISGNTAFHQGGGVYLNGDVITKSGGTIYGYSENDTVNSNVVKDDSGNVRDESGHAVYAGDSKHRETTAGPTVNLDSTKEGAAGGWKIN